MKVLISILVIFSLSGCITTPAYIPKDFAEENSAYLKADSEHDHGIFQALDERLYINTINGIAAGDFFKGYPEEAFIHTGLTEVEVKYFQGQISSVGCVKFLAEKGQRYIIRKKRETWKVKYWVELEDNKDVISIACTK